MSAMNERQFPERGSRVPGRRRQALLARLPKQAICAEIGVWKGAFSRQILEEARPLELHLIDPWEFVPTLPGRWYGGKIATSQSDMDAICRRVADQFRGH